MRKKSLGKFGEDLAVQHLEAKGYTILDRNWHVQEGEIDIVAEADGEIVFVEVKARTSDLFGRPEEAITQNKRKRIVRASLAYLQEMELLENDWRVDFIGIFCTTKGEVINLDHFENIIQGELEDFL